MDLYGDVLGAGALVGDWEIQALSGQGGYAAVYRATGDHRGPVAIKIMHRSVARSLRNIRRFEREARVISSLADPRVVTIIETGCLEDGRPFLVTEWIEGEDLAARIDRLGAMSADEVLDVVREVGLGLAAAHRAGVIHRDVKPQNVIYAERDGAPRVKLIDFGIAKLFDGSADTTALTTTGAVGSPIAMSPEQLRGKGVDARTDIYGLGVLMFFLAAGQLPFSGADPGVLEHLHLTAPPPSLSSLVPAPPWLDVAIQRCLAKAPDDRFGSVTELLEHLESGREAERDGRVTMLRLQIVEVTAELDTLLDAARNRLEAAGASVAFETGDGLCAHWSGAALGIVERALATARALVGPGVAASLELSTPAGVMALSGWPDSPGVLRVSDELSSLIPGGDSLPR